MGKKNSASQRSKRQQKAAQKGQRKLEQTLRLGESLKELSREQELKVREARQVQELRETIHEGAQLGGYNSYDMGAVIKTYHDYIERGLITPSSNLNKYEAAEEFMENVMSLNEMKAAIKQADTWAKTRNDAAERKRRKMAKENSINF